MRKLLIATVLAVALQIGTVGAAITEVSKALSRGIAPLTDSVLPES
jgi:hypothetical protein